MTVDFNVVPFPQQPQPRYDRADILDALRATSYRWVPEVFPRAKSTEMFCALPISLAGARETTAAALSTQRRGRGRVS
jgi:hypothetical protein